MTSPCIVIRGPATLANIQPILSVYQAIACIGLKKLEKGNDACSVVCGAIKKIMNPSKIKEAIKDSASWKPKLDECETYGAIALDRKGFICALQVSINRAVVVRHGLYAGKEGGLSICSEASLADSLARKVQTNISPACACKQLFAAGKQAKGPLGGITMDACGAVGVATVKGIMPWAVERSGGFSWAGYQTDRCNVFYAD